MNAPNQMSRAALDYLRRGWAPIPVRSGSKAPNLPGWDELEVTAATVNEYFNETTNVGVRLGQPSGGLLDVDLDSAEAILMANIFLPVTDAVFGRPSKVASHRLYIVDPPPPSERFKDPDGTMLLESRSTRCQTVFPPSSHSGETVLWVKGGSPSTQNGPDLLARIRRLAAASLLARHWGVQGPGRRLLSRWQEACRDWGGVQRKSGIL
jgi:Bifunctional DNA primase/polymerase, N-terminal